MISECGAIDGIRIDRENQNTRGGKPIPVPFLFFLLLEGISVILFF
jgi:hypothetical protein